MAEIKNSKLLTIIIDHARALAATGAEPLTAEKLLAAVIDLMEDEQFITENKKEIEPLLKLLNPDTTDLSRVKTKLLQYVRGNQSASFLDGLYMQKKLMEARKIAQDNQADALYSNVVLQCILEDPSEAIKACLTAVSGIPSENPPETNSVDDQIARLEAQLMKKSGRHGTADTGSQEKASSVKPKSTGPKPGSDAKESIAQLTQKVKRTQEKLLSAIYGQDNAISVFTTGYFQAELLSMTDKKRTRPRATFLFAGPPGVGKTFLAETAAEVLGLPFMRFDMSEYSDKEANLEFCGADKVYKNAKAGNVTGFVAEHPQCVLLFDEIEKAHMSVIHLFLQLLDAGRLRDNYTDQEVAFTDAIIIFTTNAGRQLYENAESGDFSGLSRKVILKALQKDLNPETGVPFFPAAICSRFASGNVVMFNHIAAHDLREIARREVLRHADNFAREIGIQVQIDERVYTSLLFAEGGSADARTIRSRAETFFDDELFELFRMVASEKVKGSIRDLETISIDVELPRNDPELSALFACEEKQEVLVFSGDRTAAACAEKTDKCSFINIQSIGEASGILDANDVKLVLIDLSFGRKEEQKYLNIEDAESDARDFFWYIRTAHKDLPIYLLQTGELTFNEEEKQSYLRQGVRGILTLTEGADGFADRLDQICGNLHQQRSMANLARSNKIVTFETAQSLCTDGKQANITLFDFELVVAVDAEDSQNILSNVSKPNVRFDQVIGAEDAKRELQYFVSYLKNPRKYRSTGVRAPKGVLLYGPPGTGKTMLAKAMASESDVTFITAEGNQFLKKYVGEGPEKVHELFRTARKYAPSILFIDEIDAIAKERKGGERAEAGEETLTAFLTEMDGFKSDPNKPVFVLAATNFDVEAGKDKSLDPALMRRFDRRVYIDLPNRDDRIRYMRMKLAGNPAFEVSEEKIENITIRSTGMSLAELESVFELALRSAIRDGNCKVTDAIFEEAFETFNSGESKKWDISQLERVARHEAGHAFLCWHAGEIPSYMTIVARANHGGYMQHADNEGKAIYTREELLARIRTSLGGRAAELVYYGPEAGVSTGASGDLTSATNLAQQIICTYGMDDQFGLAVIDAQSARMGGLAGEVRNAVNKILSAQMKTAVEVLSANTNAIDALVEQLLSKNHLSGKEIDRMLRQAGALPADR